MKSDRLAASEHGVAARTRSLLFGAMGAFFGFGLVALFAAGLLAVWGGPLARAWLPVGAAAIASFGLSWLLFFLGVRAERRAAEHGQCGCGPASAAWGGGAFLCYRLSDEAYDALRRGLDAGSYELRRAASLEEAERARRAGWLAGCVVGEWLPEDEWERLRQDFAMLAGYTRAIFFVGDEREIEERRGDYEGAHVFVPVGCVDEAVRQMKSLAPAQPVPVLGAVPLG